MDKSLGAASFAQTTTNYSIHARSPSFFVLTQTNKIGDDT